MTEISTEKQTELEAAAFRRLLEHLSNRTDVQNIDMMNLAGFCRNCLSNWYKDAAASDGIELFNGASNNLVFGNRIGTDPAGMVAIGNQNNGVLLVSGANGNSIGGDSIWWTILLSRAPNTTASAWACSLPDHSPTSCRQIMSGSSCVIPAAMRSKIAP